MTLETLPKTTKFINRDFLKIFGVEENLEVLYYTIEGNALFVIDVMHNVSLYNISNDKSPIKQADFISFADTMLTSGVGYIYFNAQKQYKYDFIAKLVKENFPSTLHFVKNETKKRWELYFYSDFFYIAKRLTAKKDISDACPFLLVKWLGNLIAVINDIALTPQHPEKLTKAIAQVERYIDSMKEKTGISTDFYF